MHEITLIRPSRVLFGSFFTSGEAIPPIGLAYLVSSLEKENFEVTPIDAIGEKITQYYSLENYKDTYIQGMTIEEIVAAIPKNPMFIGVSCMFSCEWFFYEALITEIKKEFPQIPIVVGGEHVSAEAENVLKVCSAVDICVVGEGEETIIELAKAFSIDRDVKSIDGILYRKENQIIKNKKRSRIKGIDSIPKPSWGKFPVQNYLLAGNSMTTKNHRAMPILASRGCPYRCTFCTSPQMWGTDIYLRNPVDVVNEMKSLIHNYQIEHIDFVDLVGVMNRAWVKELLTLMIDNNLNITWIYGAGTRSEILDQEILELFKKSKVLRIFYAPESGSAETLKRIKKRVNLDKMMKSMKMAHALGISMRAPVIYGFPEQTMKEAFQNLFFSFKLSYLGVDDVVAHSFSAHPGSELHHQLQKEGKINIDELIKNNMYNQFLTNEFNSKILFLHSWSSHIPNFLIPFFQFGGMFFSYCILFTFHPKKFFSMFNRVLIKKKPLTLPDHVLYSMFVRKKINLTQRALPDQKKFNAPLKNNAY